MIRIRKIALALSALTLAGTLAACGSSSSGAASQAVSPSGSGSSASSSAPVAASGVQTVMIKNFKFVPATLTVKVGAKVKFVNEDTTVHTATSASGKAINSANLAKGQSYTVTFTKAGTYNYICSIHPFMKGTVTVQ